MRGSCENSVAAIFDRGKIPSATGGRPRGLAENRVIYDGANEGVCRPQNKALSDGGLDITRSRDFDTQPNSIIFALLR